MDIISSNNPIYNLRNKRCSCCKTTKPLSEFYKNKHRADGHTNECKSCILDSTKEYNNRTFEQRRARDRKKRYGISSEEYEEMSNAQGNVCAICGKPETGKANTGKPRILAVDHCHKTGKIRGLLCGKCNQILGHADDNPELLIQAIKYLIAHTE